jgi:hypothetical protein
MKIHHLVSEFNEEDFDTAVSKLKTLIVTAEEAQLIVDELLQEEGVRFMIVASQVVAAFKLQEPSKVLLAHQKTLDQALQKMVGYLK